MIVYQIKMINYLIMKIPFSDTYQLISYQNNDVIIILNLIKGRSINVDLALTEHMIIPSPLIQLTVLIHNN